MVTGKFLHLISLMGKGGDSSDLRRKESKERKKRVGSRRDRRAERIGEGYGNMIVRLVR